MNPPPGLTAADVAAIWRRPTGTVYRLAHTHRWRRYQHAGRTYYHPGDINDTLNNILDKRKVERRT